MRAVLFVSLLAVTSLLVACAGLGRGVIYNRQIDATYRPSEFWTQTAGRDLRTEIYGNPFPVDHEVLVAAVTTAMHGSHFGPETNFIETPGEHSADPYRVRLLFNALPTSGMSLCSDTPLDVPPAPAHSGAKGVDVKVLAAFCASGSRITSLTAGIDGVTGPDDPAFTAFIRQVTTSLFPPNNPDQNSDRCFVPNC
jgi:hypothetical protein